MVFRSTLFSSGILGIVLLFCSQSASALRLYSQEQYQLARDRAVAEAKAGNHQSALVTLQRLLRLEPDNIGALNDYITILIWDKQYQQALDYFPKLKLNETPEYVLRSLIIAADKLKQQATIQQLLAVYFTKYPIVPQDTPAAIRGKTKSELVFLTRQAGMNQTALVILQQLLKEQPENQAYLADYINTLYLEQHYQQALDAGKAIDFNHAPEFVFDALIASAKKLNDHTLEQSLLTKYQQRFNHSFISNISKVKQREAKKIAPQQKNIPQKKSVQQQTHLSQQLKKASTFLKQKNYQQAKKILMPLYLSGQFLSEKHSSAINNEQIQLLIRYFDSQKDYQKTAYLYQVQLNKIPHSDSKDYAELNKQLVLNLFYAGAPFLALDKLAATPSVLTAKEMNKITTDTYALQLRWSVYQPAAEESSDEAKEKVTQLLASAIANSTESNDHYNQLRLQYDYIIALKQTEQMQAIIDQYQALQANSQALPDYVLNAVADAYLALQQPLIAEQMYVDLLSRQKDNLALMRSLAYAYLDQGKTTEAIHLIQTRNENTPIWRKDHSGDITKNNDEKLQVEILQANIFAYADDLDGSQTRFENMRNNAPNNLELIDNLAQVYRWRGWPETSARALQLAHTIEPDYLYAQINHTYNLIETQQFAKAEQNLAQLSNKGDHQYALQKLQKDWDLINKRQFLSWVDVGDSDSKNQASQSNYGNSDMSIESYLYDALYDNKYRPYIHQFFSQSDFTEGKDQYERLGIGVEYRQQRNTTQIELSDSYTSRSDPGISINSEQWFNDYLQLAIGYNSFSNNVPVRAYFHDIDGLDYRLSGQWRFNELSSINSGFEILDYSDGNQRDSWSLSFSHRLINQPNYKMQITPNYFQSKNSQPGGPYFAPKSDKSYGINIRNEWLSYKMSDKQFKQILELDLGKYEQETFNTETTTSFLYQHEWILNKTLSFSYGLKVSRNYYDGDKEKRKSAFASLNWLF
ncbi:poly-beta-1,6 N-acetyl-D-glucosamine export porin PgaA [sulfur-oxidizing endosymbiont of Gigantopelta aegis]|uniref:poly-beta-1,6 N-acetyl-D-glucosamine export porin PgaA n=1 Tax=sulfur-oxidizing endosymbiont of Gigantopelta aegis TaxID=2794934 RepID=UPI0018DBBA4F|nr:poly-beta-1,6 N-acetyl-D-glucosamine export porin PgaA [sulfur-oxidizing endosymbiont of Gigantopelta aegis]